MHINDFVIHTYLILSIILTQCTDREWISQNEFLSLIIQEPVPDCLEWLSVWDRVDRSKKGELIISKAGNKRFQFQSKLFFCPTKRGKLNHKIFIVDGKIEAKNFSKRITVFNFVWQIWKTEGAISNNRDGNIYFRFTRLQGVYILLYRHVIISVFFGKISIEHTNCLLSIIYVYRSSQNQMFRLQTNSYHWTKVLFNTILVTNYTTADYIHKS